MSDETELKILIAVDFGTTFSGMAYVDTKNPARRSIIQEWGQGGLTGEKAPTVLKYDNDGTTGPFKWGFQVPDDAKRHEWFKLQLCPEALRSSALSIQYPSPSALPRVTRDECETLVVDYLTSLRKRAEDFLRSHFGNMIFETTAREYIITVPAIWTDRAQARTRICAVKAGMGDLQIISEPEAAGIFAINTMPNIGLEVGDTFVLCDAGGGTVDLASYTIRSFQPAPVLDEAAGNTGELCGSTFLNRIFVKYLEDRMRGCRGWDEDYQGDVLRFFEKDIKPKFTGDNETYRVKVQGLPDNPRYGIFNKRLEISAKDLRKEVFKPVAQEIQRLVREQINASTTETVKVKAVLLAGGFGRNEYLRRKLQEVVDINIEVRPVVDSNTAIVQGALLRGLEDKSSDTGLPNWRIGARIANKHFGIECFEDFDPHRHDISRREPHPNEGGYRIQTMKWVVKKGQRVEDGRPTRIPGFWVDKRVSEGPPKQLLSEIFVCQDPDPPIYSDRTDSVKKHATLTVDLRPIPEELLVKETRSGIDYYRVDFEIEMTLHSASLTFSLIYDGRAYQTVNVEFD